MKTPTLTAAPSCPHRLAPVGPGPSAVSAPALSVQTKRRIAFALIMGVVTTGIISFTLIALNFGFAPGFVLVWARSWMTGYVIAIPAILLIGPRLQAQIERRIS